MDKEQWKDILGWEGVYQVSSFGNVMSYQRTIPKVLKQSFINDSVSKKKTYLTICLFDSKRGIKKNVYVHKLVAEAFISGKEYKNQVNHKDGNKLNNNVSNLEWVSHSENVKHSYRVGLSEKRGRITKPTDTDRVLKIRELYKEGWSMAKIGRNLVMPESTVWGIVHNRSHNNSFARLT